MDAGRALDRLRADLGDDLRVFAVVRPDAVDVPHVRADVDDATAAVTDDVHESHLRDVASAMLATDTTATIRYTPDAIVVGLPTPDDGATGYLLSLDHDASDTVTEFVDALLDAGATVLQTTTASTTPTPFDDDSDAPHVNE